MDSGRGYELTSVRPVRGGASRGVWRDDGVACRGCRSTSVALPLDGVDFECAPGEVVGLIGSNGAGKTTLLNVLSVVHRSDRGSVSVDGDPMVHVPVHEAARRGGEDVPERPTLPSPHRPATRRSGSSRRPAVGRKRSAAARRRCRARGLGIACGRRTACLPASLCVAAPRRDRSAYWPEPRDLLLDEPAAGTNEIESSELARIVLSARPGRLRRGDRRTRSRLRVRAVDVGARPRRGAVLAEGPPAVVQSDPKVVEVYIGSTPGRAGPALNRDRGAEN